MQKSAYKTKQQELLLSYLSGMKGKHFTAEEIRAHFEAKKISIGIATIYRQLEKLVNEGKIQKYFIDENSAACFEYAGEECRAGEKHFHLKCELCGHLKAEHGFVINPLRTVFYGLCSDCASKQKIKK